MMQFLLEHLVAREPGEFPERRPDDSTADGRYTQLPAARRGEVGPDARHQRLRRRHGPGQPAGCRCAGELRARGWRQCRAFARVLVILLSPLTTNGRLKPARDGKAVMATQIIQIGRQRSSVACSGSRCRAGTHCAPRRWSSPGGSISTRWCCASTAASRARGFASTREGAQLGLPSLGALVSKVIRDRGARSTTATSSPRRTGSGRSSCPMRAGRISRCATARSCPNGDWVGTGRGRVRAPA